MSNRENPLECLSDFDLHRFFDAVFPSGVTPRAAHSKRLILARKVFPDRPKGYLPALKTLGRVANITLRVREAERIGDSRMVENLKSAVRVSLHQYLDFILSPNLSIFQKGCGK